MTRSKLTWTKHTSSLYSSFLSSIWWLWNSVYLQHLSTTRCAGIPVWFRPFCCIYSKQNKRYLKLYRFFWLSAWSLCAPFIYLNRFWWPFYWCIHVGLYESIIKCLILLFSVLNSFHKCFYKSTYWLPTNTDLPVLDSSTI